MNADLVVPLDVYIADQRKALADLMWEDIDDPRCDLMVADIERAVALWDSGQRHYPMF